MHLFHNLPRSFNLFCSYCHSFIYLFFLSMLVGLWELNSPSGYCTQCPLQWKLGVLTTGQPGNFLPKTFLTESLGLTFML